MKLASFPSSFSKLPKSFSKYLLVSSILTACSAEPPDRYANLRSTNISPASGTYVFHLNHSDPGALVAEREVLVSIRQDVPERETLIRIIEAISDFNPRRVGSIPPLRMYQYQIDSSENISATINAASQVPGVITAGPNYLLSSLTDPNPPPRNYDVYDGYWWINSIRARDAWSITTGSAEIPIGIVDRPVDRSFPQFRGKIITTIAMCQRSQDGRLYISPDTPHPCPDPTTDPHGSNVAAIAAADGADRIPGVGLAWTNPIISVDIWGPRSSQPLSCGKYFTPIYQVVSGIMTAISAGARVVNVSIGISGCLKDPNTCDCIGLYSSEHRARIRSDFLPALEYANRNNALVVFAAGNDGFKQDNQLLPSNFSPTYPNYFSSNALIVSGNDELDNPACSIDYTSIPFCSDLASARYGSNARCDCVYCNPVERVVSSLSVEGSVVDIAAPAYRIALLSRSGETSVTLDSAGTSLAAPMVAGTAALVWGLNPSLRANQVRQILLDTARRGGCRQIGRGILDAAAAVRRARGLISPSMDSGASVDASTDVQTDSTSNSPDVITGTPVSIGRTYGLGSFNHVRRFGSTIIASGISSTTSSGVTNHHVRFVNYDFATGNLHWLRTVDSPGNYLIDNSTNLLDVVATSDGYVSAYSIGQPSGRLYLVKIGFDGQVHWLRDLSSSAIGQATQVSRLFAQMGGSVLLVSRSNFSNDAGSRENSVLTSFDSNGNIQFSRSFIQPAYSYLGRYPILDSVLFSNRVIAFYSRDAISLDTSGNSPNRSSYDYFENLRLVSGNGSLRGFTPDEILPDGGVIGGNIGFDSAGSIITREPFSIAGLNFVSFSDVQVTSDGFLISGAASDLETIGSVRALLIRLNSSGQVIWRRLYGEMGSSFQSASQINSGFVAVGTYTGYAWVVRTDEFGNPIR